MADLDHFKSINDTHGHHMGDQVLSVVSDSFMQQLRPYDSIFRYGGEEFLFCLPDTDLGTAKVVSERVRAAVEAVQIELEDGKALKVTASFGVAQMDVNATLEGTVESADRALYAAKDGGRNMVSSAE